MTLNVYAKVDGKLAKFLVGTDDFSLGIIEVRNELRITKKSSILATVSTKESKMETPIQISKTTSEDNSLTAIVYLNVDESYTVHVSGRGFNANLSTKTLDDAMKQASEFIGMAEFH